MSGLLMVVLVLAVLIAIVIAKTAVVVPQQSAFVVERLGKLSKSCQDDKAIAQVGTISANGDSEIGSIIATPDRSKRYTQGVPLLTNRTLFQRDHNLCLYCGEVFNPAHLTRDHIMPASRGGGTTWLNCVTACKLTPPEALLVRGSASRTSINYCDVMNARTSVSNQFKSRVH